MTYTLEWLETFDGEIDILNVDMSCLAILLRNMFLSTNTFIRQIWRTILKLFSPSQIPLFPIY